jgi:hypothetical protein
MAPNPGQVVPSPQQERAKPEANKTECDNPQTAKYEDICQQRRMADAAERTLSLGNSQWWLTLASIIASVVAIGVAAWASIAAGDAAKAAVESNKIARDIGQAQVSAYLACEDGQFTLGAHSLHGHVNVRNYGQSPAKRVGIKFSLSTQPNWSGGDLMPTYPPGEDIKTFETWVDAVQPSETARVTFFWRQADLGESNLRRITSDNFHFVVGCEVVWKTVFPNGRALRTHADLSNQIEFVQIAKDKIVTAGDLHVRNRQS